MITFIKLFLMTPEILNMIVGPQFSMIQASLYKRNNCSKEVESKAYFQCLGKASFLDHSTVSYCTFLLTCPPTSYSAFCGVY